jgi:Na+/H+ antiporter NhaD/arsenite permease-like protein
VPTIIGAVYYFGDEVDRVIRVIQKIEHGIGFFMIGLFLLIGLKWYFGRRKRA